MFVSRPPDLIVPIGGPASTFAHRYRQRLFPATPMLLAAVDERHLQQFTFTPDETVVAVRHDAPQAIETIQKILPQTSTVFVVIGNSPLEQFWREDLVSEFATFSEPVNICLGQRTIFRRNAEALCHSSAELGDLLRAPLCGCRWISSYRGRCAGAASRCGRCAHFRSGKQPVGTRNRRRPFDVHGRFEPYLSRRRCSDSESRIVGKR